MLPTVLAVIAVIAAAGRQQGLGGDVREIDKIEMRARQRDPENSWARYASCREATSRLPERNLPTARAARWYISSGDRFQPCPLFCRETNLCSQHDDTSVAMISLRVTVVND